jgi:hypothetical protein
MHWNTGTVLLITGRIVAENLGKSPYFELIHAGKRSGLCIPLWRYFRHKRRAGVDALVRHAELARKASL